MLEVSRLAAIHNIPKIDPNRHPKKGSAMGQTICFSCRRDLTQISLLNPLAVVCDMCFNALLTSPDEVISTDLESFNVPAALLSKDHAIVAFNHLFQTMASSHDILGRRVGEVLGCSFSPLLGRCEETVACRLCWLKRSIAHTSLTGEELHEMPLRFPNKVEIRKAFAITTTKIGGAVLLLMRRSIPNPRPKWSVPTVIQHRL